MALVEQPDSPLHEFGENIVLTRTWRGPHPACVAAAPYRSALGSGIASGYKVAESRVARERGGIGILSVKYEINGQPSGAMLPPDDFDLSFQQLDRPLRSHSRYVTLTKEAQGYVHTAVETADTDPAHADALVRIAALPGAQEQLCYELIDRLNRGISSYLLWYPKVRRTIFSWTAPSSTSKGGFTQTPVIPGLTVPTGVTWLREGDQLNFNGTHWQLTQSWFGAPDLIPGLYPTS